MNLMLREKLKKMRLKEIDRNWWEHVNSSNKRDKSKSKERYDMDSKHSDLVLSSNEYIIKTMPTLESLKEES